MGVLMEAGDALASIDAVLADNHSAMCAGAVDRLFAFPDLTDVEGADLIASEWRESCGVWSQHWPDGAGSWFVWPGRMHGELTPMPGVVYSSSGFMTEMACAADEWPPDVGMTVVEGDRTWTELLLRHPARDGGSLSGARGPSSGEVWSVPGSISVPMTGDLWVRATMSWDPETGEYGEQHTFSSVDGEVWFPT